MLQISELKHSINSLSEEIEIESEQTKTSLFIAFTTHSGYDYSKLQPGDWPTQPVAYQAYILAHATNVITQNGEIEDQMLNIPFSQFEILIRDNLSITLTLRTI